MTWKKTKLQGVTVERNDRQAEELLNHSQIFKAHNQCHTGF